MKEYHLMFEIVVAYLPEILEIVFKGNFINGLSPMVWAEVRMLKPQGLGQIMELARWIEDWSELVKRAQMWVGPFHNKSPSYNQILSSPTMSSPNSFNNFLELTQSNPRALAILPKSMIVAMDIFN